MDFDEFETLSSINERQEPFAPGQYVLVSGQRLADGTVLCRSNFFVVNPDETTTVDLVVRQDTTALQVIGSLNAELPYRPFGGGEPTSLISTTGRGYYVLALVAPGHEPSAHALNDIAAAAADLEKDRSQDNGGFSLTKKARLGSRRRIMANCRPMSSSESMSMAVLPKI